MSASTEGTLRVDKTKVESMLPLLKEAADKLREENYVETRVAVLDVMREGMRVEYFRGKDFARYWEKKPGELAYYLGKTDEDEEPKSAEEIQKMTVMLMCYLITAGLLKAAERRHTKPRPGKKKLSKWPTQLITVQPSWREDLFYTYTYERPRGMMFYVYATLLLAFAGFCCCYSIVPNQIKLYIAYASMSLLVFIFGLLSVRYVIFVAVYIVSGYSFWLFPSLLSDDVPVTECLVPRISLDSNKDDTNLLWKRGFVVGLIIVTVYALSEHGPDQTQVKMFTLKAHDQVLSMLRVEHASIAGSVEETVGGVGTGTNTTQEAGEGGMRAGAKMEEETVTGDSDHEGAKTTAAEGDADASASNDAASGSDGEI